MLTVDDMEVEFGIGIIVLVLDMAVLVVDMADLLPMSIVVAIDVMFMLA